MKPIIPFALLSAFLAVGAQGAATKPVGYVSLGDTTPGQPAVKANTDARVSVPLLNTASSAGVIAAGGIAGSVLTIDGAAYADDEWIGFFALVTSGANDGQLLVVTDNDATSLTVETTSPGDTLTGLAAADGISLSPATTLDSVFGDQPVGTQVLAFSGMGDGENLAADVIYEFGNAFGLLTPDQWFNQGSLAAAGSAPLFPGEGLIVRTAATEITSLVVTGEVPTSNHRIVISGGGSKQDSPFGYISPVDEPISGAGISAVVGDQILVFNNGAAGQNKASDVIYEFGNAFGLLTPDQWFNQGSLGALTDDDAFEGGSSYIYRTADAASDLIWSDEQAYIPSL